MFERIINLFPDIDSNKIQVVLFNLELFNSSELFSLLSNDEKLRADKLKIIQKKDQFIITRAVLRQLLSNSIGKEPHLIQFMYQEHCKPYISDHLNNKVIEFNISHSGNYALVGITVNYKIGVDIEEINSEIDCQSLSNRFFSEKEKKDFFSLPDSEQLDAFYRLWTRKESFIKATGKGVAFGLDRFTVATEVHSTKIKVDIPDFKDEWYCQDVTAPKNYKAALTVSTVDSGVELTDLTE